MEFGILVDSAFEEGLVRGPERILEWVRGLPDRSWLTRSFKAAPADRLRVETLRCTACGFVELYSPDE